VGVAALTRLITAAGSEMSDEVWGQCMHTLSAAALDTLPEVRPVTRGSIHETGGYVHNCPVYSRHMNAWPSRSALAVRVFCGINMRPSHCSLAIYVRRRPLPPSSVAGRRLLLWCSAATTAKHREGVAPAQGTEGLRQRTRTINGGVVVMLCCRWRSWCRAAAAVCHRTRAAPAARSRARTWSSCATRWPPAPAPAASAWWVSAGALSVYHPYPSACMPV